MRQTRPTLVIGAFLAAAAAMARQPVETVPPPAAVPAADTGYALGYRIGERILADHEGLGLDIDPAALARGLADAVTGSKPALDEARLAQAIATFEAALTERQEAFAARMREAGRANLAKGRDFLAANSRRPGVVVRPSGLQYEVIREGDGPVPGADDVIVARYRGTRIDGAEFDASDPGGEPATFPLRGVVPGWQEALPLMKAGSKWKLWIPPELAYGAEGSPPVIEPNEVLVFEIELVRSQPAESVPAP